MHYNTARQDWGTLYSSEEGGGGGKILLEDWLSTTKIQSL